MKKLPVLSSVMLCGLFACETDTSQIASDPIYAYNTEQQYQVNASFIIDFKAFNTAIFYLKFF
jgi:hypothetical protein